MYTMFIYLHIYIFFSFKSINYETIFVFYVNNNIIFEQFYKVKLNFK